MSKRGILYLIPNTLGGGADTFATQQAKMIASETNVFIVEEIRSARRLLRNLGVTVPLEELEFYELNEHTKPDEWPQLMEPLLAGKNVGLMSEAGLPCIADPGNVAVKLAHENKIKVVPLSGPSSIMMTLMSSGMNGQEFCFNGYLPREKNDRIKKIKQLEQLALRGQTQLFMDAPYRNNQLLDDLLAHCKMDTRLCIAKNISLDNEQIRTKQIFEWHIDKQDLHKQLVMFALGK